MWRPRGVIILTPPDERILVITWPGESSPQSPIARKLKVAEEAPAMVAGTGPSAAWETRVPRVPPAAATRAVAADARKRAIFIIRRRPAACNAISLNESHTRPRVGVIYTRLHVQAMVCVHLLFQDPQHAAASAAAGMAVLV